MRGWNLSGQNVNLEEGTAIVTRRADAKRWNDECLTQIHQTLHTKLQALDVQGHGQHSFDTQAPEVLQLRTCPDHRMRLMLVNNLDITGGWATGTRVRLLANDSWSKQANATSMLHKTIDEKQHCSYTAHKLTLDDNKEFLARMIKDEASTTSKSIRYKAADITQVAPRAEEGKSKYTHHKKYTQVPLTPAYALTAHKAQGLNIPKTYLSWAKMFGFGAPYTILFTPLKWVAVLFTIFV